MTEKTVEIHCYADQLIDNTDGMYDDFGSAWFIVPIEWAEKRAKKDDWKDLNHFFSEYTYDTTDGWLKEAMKEGVLRGCGTGSENATENLNGWEPK